VECILVSIKNMIFFPSYRFCLVQLDKCIYAVGGCSQDGILSSVARFTEDTEEWETVAPMPRTLRSYIYDYVIFYVPSR